MKKIMLLTGLGLVLASCGGGSVYTGGASLQVTNIRTNYQDASDAQNPYGSVACDTAFDSGGNATSKTQVAVYFTASGTVSSVRVQLKGQTTSQYDGNFDATFTGSQLQSLGGNNFKVIFDADSGSNALPLSVKPRVATSGVKSNSNSSIRPLAIIPTPTQTTVKVVNTPNTYLGNFYANLTLTDGNGNSGSAQSGLIHVYDQCYITSDTGTTL